MYNVEPERLPKKVAFLSRSIVQLVLFAIFSILFALPAIRKYQQKEVGTNNLTHPFQRVLHIFQSLRMAMYYVITSS